MKTKPEKLFFLLLLLFLRDPRKTVKWPNNVQWQICWTLLSIKKKRRFGGAGILIVHNTCVFDASA